MSSSLPTSEGASADGAAARRRESPLQLPLLPCIERRRSEAPNRLAFTTPDVGVTRTELGAQVEAAARRLIAGGVRWGDRVVVAEEAPARFLPVFLGILRAGAVAVPILPRAGAERLLDVAGLCDASYLVVGETARAHGDALDRAVGSRGRMLLSVGEVLAGPRVPASGLPHEPGGDDLALLQLTSGSTGHPKAVTIRHRELAANLAQMVEGLELSASDIFVSWLPLHHDMGLMLMALLPLALGAELHLSPPGMARMRSWMADVAHRGGTFTAAPDFAYRLSIRLQRSAADLDLASLRVALNAAEPVRASTVESFSGVFRLGPVMTPAYGLAEATVGVTCWPPGRPIKVDERGGVSVGRGFPGVELAILGPTGLLPAGEEGEILVRGPAVTDGYWGDPEASAELRWNGWLRTGDLGLLDPEGDLFVVGRIKEVILQGGQTLAPREVEEAVERVPGVRRAAAVGIDRGGLQGEQAYVFVEPERGLGSDGPSALATRVGRAFERRLGHRAGRIYVVAPGTIPRTANGKLRYGELRDNYLGGGLRRQDAILFPDF